MGTVRSKGGDDSAPAESAGAADRAAGESKHGSRDTSTRPVRRARQTDDDSKATPEERHHLDEALRMRGTLPEEFRFLEHTDERRLRLMRANLSLTESIKWIDDHCDQLIEQTRPLQIARVRSEQQFQRDLSLHPPAPAPVYRSERESAESEAGAPAQPVASDPEVKFAEAAAEPMSASATVSEAPSVRGARMDSTGRSAWDTVHDLLLAYREWGKRAASMRSEQARISAEYTDRSEYGAISVSGLSEDIQNAYDTMTGLARQIERHVDAYFEETRLRRDRQDASIQSRCVGKVTEAQWIEFEKQVDGIIEEMQAVCSEVGGNPRNWRMPVSTA